MEIINLGNCPILSLEDLTQLPLRLAKVRLLHRMNDKQIVKVNKYMNEQYVIKQIKQQKRMYDLINNWQKFVIENHKKGVFYN